MMFKDLPVGSEFIIPARTVDRQHFKKTGENTAQIIHCGKPQETLLVANQEVYKFSK